MHFLILLSCLAGLYAASDVHYRLPTSINPEKYKLKILTLFEENRFEGDVMITLNVVKNTKNITLHALDLDIDKSKTVLKLTGSSDKICIQSTEVNVLHEYYIMHLCRELQAGKTYELSMSFGAQLKNEFLGYFAMSYNDTSKNATKWMSATQFEPIEARKAFPCFDEPALKARFTISLGHEKHYVALSNMPLLTTRVNNDLQNYVWSDFAESLPMSSYLVAYSLNDFASTTSPRSKDRRTIFKTWASSEVIRNSKFSASFGPDVLDYFEKLFDIPFPLPKIDQLAVRDFDSGGMENWGLIVYSESALLVDSEKARVMDQYNTALLMGHELAHQWFGNLVTMEWWTDLWLNEGFATFLSSVAVEDLQKDWQSNNLEALGDYSIIFDEDALETSHAVVREIITRTDMSEAFDQISYRKGSIVVRMIYLILGRNTFRSGLSEYLKKFSYGNAKQDELWDMLTKAAHRDGILSKNMTLKTIMDSWTLQVGYPVLNAVRNYDQANTVKISQARYLKNRDERERLRDEPHCWWVPLSYTTASEREFNRTTPKSWMTCSGTTKAADKTIQLKGNTNDWFLLNVQIAALYRINYDERNWRLLIKALKCGNLQEIHVLNRVQLLNDAFALARSGDLSYEVVLNLLTYLERELEFLPWLDTIKNLEAIEPFLRKSEHYEAVYKKFLRRLFTPAYKHLNGLNDTFRTLRSNTAVQHKELMAKWACELGIGDCVEKARTYFKEWRRVLKSNPKAESPVPINLAHVVYCTGVEHGNSDDWNFVWTQYNTNENAAEKNMLLVALTCTLDDGLLNTLLERAFKVERPIEGAKMIVHLLLKEKAYHKTTDYLLKNTEAVMKFFHPFVKPEQYFEEVLVRVTSRDELSKIKEVFKCHTDLQGAVFTKMLKNAEVNLLWVEQHYEAFWKALNNLEQTEKNICSV